MTYLSNFSNILMLAFGFGFVIFWHELGHFLAAKWAKVKVEQFAVGFGQAVVCWRKGLGFTWGTSQDQFMKRVKAHIETKQVGQVQLKELISPTESQIAHAATELGISETEYRLNWIPLGGYVKMMGQDDLKPGQTVSDPRSYNNKTIGQRMVIVSAGVVMNIILAAIGFMYIFTVGFEAPRPQIGSVLTGSPAQHAYRIVGDKHEPAPLQVGDEILTLNGHQMHDFEKIKLNTVLAIAGERMELKVRRHDPAGREEIVYVEPAKATADAEFPLIGVGEYQLLKAPPKTATTMPSDGSSILPEMTVLKPGDVITAVNGKPVTDEDYSALVHELQQASGKEVPVTVVDNDGKGSPRPQTLVPHFAPRFDDKPLNFAGMELPDRIDVIQANSPLLKPETKGDDKLAAGDVITSITEPQSSGSQMFYPPHTEILKEFGAAGEKGVKLRITVNRDGKPGPTIEAKPTVKIDSNRMGFGVILGVDEADPIVAGVLPDSPAKAAGIRPGSILKSINGTPVSNWFDVFNILRKVNPDEPIKVTAAFGDESKDYVIKSLTKEQIEDIGSNRLEAYATGALIPAEHVRQANGPAQAFTWGVEETRDAILQVYQTVRSMSRGSISAKEVSGPLGILSMGYKVAERGSTRLIWFLSIISANLAVMNFLPIPIVDGGLFTFLIIEKLKGSPISQRTQSIAQVVGLVLLLSVFVFATYQDVGRLSMIFK